MRVALGTIEVDDRVRRALRAYYGETGLATREEVRSFFRMAGETAISNVARERDREASR